jgi:hypothetical protein
LVKLALVHLVLHFPQDHQSPLSAKKTPLPHLGQKGFERASLPSFTAYLAKLASSEAFDLQLLRLADTFDLVDGEIVGGRRFDVALLDF